MQQRATTMGSDQGLHARVLQAEGRHMLQQGYGRIINTASMASLLVPHPQKQIAYNASKAAVVKITETLGAEWADRGLTVNCMSPGIVNTALIQVWLQASLQKACRKLVVLSSIHRCISVSCICSYSTESLRVHLSLSCYTCKCWRSPLRQ